MVQLAWAVPKDDDFVVKDFALNLLEIAQENLTRDHQLVPVSFMVTADQLQCYSVTFADQEEKPAAYAELIQAAREANAAILITCNDAYWKNNARPEDLEGYYPGKLAAEGARECIMLTVSGPAIDTWCVEVPYERTASGIEFGESLESSGQEIGFLQGWAGSKRAVN